MEDVFDSTDLRTEFQEKKKALTRRYYIGVEEGVSKEDVGRAFDRIPTLHKTRLRGGAPRRDPLVALQCALLYDHYNGRDHQDRRRKKWTYEKLAEKFVLPSAGAAEDHVIYGREIIEAKPRE